MEMKKNDVVSVVATSGEYVGKLKKFDEKGVVLSDPRMLIAANEGVGFAKGVCMTGQTDVSEVLFRNYVYCTPTNEEFEKAWREATSGIVTT